MAITLLPEEIGPLLVASKRGDVEYLQKRVAELADAYGVVNGEVLIAAKDEMGTVLHAASELGLTDVLAWTMSESNFPNQPGLRSTFLEQRNNLGNTAVNEAAKNNQPPYLEALLNFGAYVDTHNGFGFTALHYAVKDQHQSLVTILLARGATTSIYSISGDTPLHIATRNRDVATSSLLLQHGAPQNWVNGAGDAPLHTAVRTGDRAIIAQLLDFGGPIDIPNRMNGDTPAHLAVRDNNVTVLGFLLQRGASYTARNLNGLTSYELARLKGLEEVEAAFFNFWG